MPLAHNLNKVTKNISKSTGSLHIKGRKFKQLNRATLRDKKLQQRKSQSLERKSNELSIVFFIQSLLQEKIPLMMAVMKMKKKEKTLRNSRIRNNSH